MTWSPKRALCLAAAAAWFSLLSPYGLGRTVYKAAETMTGAGCFFPLPPLCCSAMRKQALLVPQED